MNIIFICKHNRFRSRVAEGYFKKIKKNKKIKISSAGLIKGIPVSRNLISITKKLEFNVKGKTKGLDEKVLTNTDLIIITANDIPKSIFKRFNKPVIVWKIKDAEQSDSNAIKKTINKIMNKVDKFNRKLEKGKWKQ